MTLNLHKANFLLISTIFLFTTCEEPTKAEPKDTTPPTVSIVSPKDGEIVSGITSIEVNSQDDQGVRKIELWVDGTTTGITDTTKPYSLEWNTESYENSSVHTIMVRAYDLDDNSADSETITVTVDNIIRFTKKIIEGDVSWVQQTPDDGYIVLGWVANEVLLLKTDPEGSEEWRTTFGGDVRYTGSMLQQTTDGGYFITGFTSDSEGWESVLLIKTDANGNEEWIKIYGEDEDVLSFSGHETADGGFIATGTTVKVKDGSGYYKVFLLKTDSNGDEEWYQIFDYDNDESNEGYDVEPTSGGDYVILYSGGRWNQTLMKVDSEGSEKWKKELVDPNYGVLVSIEPTTDGGYIITGNTEYDGTELWLIKTDSEGNKVWEFTFGSDDLIGGRMAQQTAEGGYIVGARGITDDFNEQYPALVKTNSDGGNEWIKKFKDLSGAAYTVQQTSDGGYIFIVGNGIMVKTDSEGDSE